MIFAIDVLTNLFFRFFFLIILKKNFSLLFRILFLLESYASNLMKTNDDSHFVAQ